MKQADMIKRILSGEPIVVVEYRAFKPDTIRYRDKKSGAAVERHVIKHSVEMGDMQVQVTEWLPDGVDLGTVKPTFSKGQRLALKLNGMEPNQGFYQATGDLIPLELEVQK